ncbi:hypothetical protein McpSp1_04980 [Methanocorpusculaceae archaeon Sp1]|nr:hypothetical protein [Methanocorpusculaceae archaeon Sp1]
MMNLLVATQFTDVLILIPVFLISTLVLGYAVYQFKKTSDKGWRIRYTILILGVGFVELLLLWNFVDYLMITYF